MMFTKSQYVISPFFYFNTYFKGKKAPVACVGGIMEADTIVATMVKKGLAKQDGLMKVVEPKPRCLSRTQ
jgi:hypothetical protein